jgi:hypothetical protein
MRLADEYDRETFRSDCDTLGFVILVFWRPETSCKVRSVGFDLISVYARLRAMQQLQHNKADELRQRTLDDVRAGFVRKTRVFDEGPDGTYEIFEFGSAFHRVDFRQFDFSAPPPAAHGVFIDNVCVYQFPSAGLPSPGARAVVLARLIAMTEAVDTALRDGIAYMGDLGLPPDITIPTVDKTSLISVIREKLDPAAAPLTCRRKRIHQDGEVVTMLDGAQTVRLTLLDVLRHRPPTRTVNEMYDDGQPILDEEGLEDVRPAVRMNRKRERLIEKPVTSWNPDWLTEAHPGCEVLRILRANLVRVAEFDYAHNKPDAEGVFGPNSMVHWPALLALLRSKSKGYAQYTLQFRTMREVWEAFPRWLLGNGFSSNALFDLLYEEDHCRITWTM